LTKRLKFSEKINLKEGISRSSETVERLHLLDSATNMGRRKSIKHHTAIRGCIQKFPDWVDYEI